MLIVCYRLIFILFLLNFRYLVASKDLEPGDVIIIAEPLVVGPYTGCELICLGCYHQMIGDPTKYVFYIFFNIIL